ALYGVLDKLWRYLTSQNISGLRNGLTSLRGSLTSVKYFRLVDYLLGKSIYILSALFLGYLATRYAFNNFSEGNPKPQLFITRVFIIILLGSISLPLFYKRARRQRLFAFLFEESSPYPLAILRISCFALFFYGVISGIDMANAIVGNFVN